MTNLNAKQLLRRYQTGKCTLEERRLIEDYFINIKVTEQDLRTIEADLHELWIRGMNIPE